MLAKPARQGWDRQSPLLGACLVENLYRYAVGRKQAMSERRLLRHLEGQFEVVGYRLPDLMREIAMSEGFRTASPPTAPATEVSTAEATSRAKEKT